MPSAVDQRFRDAAYPADTSEAFVYLVEIDHPSLPVPIRLTTSERDLELAGGEIYVAAPFELEPPGQVEDDPRGRIVVPNVDQRIGAAINSISTPATVTITQVLESDPDVVVFSFGELELQDVRGNAAAFEGALGYTHLATEPWPSDIIGPDKYRATFRVL